MTKRPEALGLVLALSSLDDVNCALHELGWIEHEAAIVDARTKTTIERLKKRADQRMVVEIDGEKRSFADRAKELRAAISTWCQTHLAEHLPEKAKSLTLSHGRVGRTGLPPIVQFVEGKDESSVVAAIENKRTVKGLLKSLLNAAVGLVTLNQLVRVKLELDKTAVKKVWKLGAEQRATLKGLGVIVATEREGLIIEPAQVDGLTASV